MGTEKRYLKISGVNGPVKTKGFEQCIEIVNFRELSFPEDRETLQVSTCEVILSNPDRVLRNELEHLVFDPKALREIIIYEVKPNNIMENVVYQMIFHDAHFTSYQHHEGNNFSLLFETPHRFESHHYTLADKPRVDTDIDKGTANTILQTGDESLSINTPLVESLTISAEETKKHGFFKANSSDDSSIRDISERNSDLKDELGEQKTRVITTLKPQQNYAPKK